MNSGKAFGYLLAAGAFALCTGAHAQRTFDTDILTEDFGFDENTKRVVSFEDLHQGCPERDCIPSIDNPIFVTAEEARFLSEDDIVLTLSRNGKHRAYPTKILDHHEIVNDEFGETPIAVTWCPLCGSGVGVIREVNGRVTQFGVSGVLYNSDLVFYDRATNTLWDQIEARGIVGPLTGVNLELVPVGVTRWSTWKTAHPDTDVLSTNTGHELDYTGDPYSKYRDGRTIVFPVLQKSDALHPKTVVYGFQVDGSYVAYTAELLAADSGYLHEFNGRPVRVALAEDGSATLTDLDSNTTYSPVRLFWFAWYTFHPDTQLVR